MREPRPFFGRIPCIALLVLLAASSLQAASWPVARGPSHEPLPYHYNPAQWKQVPRAFLEETPACILYSGATYLLEADGTLETIVHEITRFNGRKGIDKLGEYRNISYNPSYQNLTLNEARIHKAGGGIVPIEVRHVQLRDLGTDYQVYDHEKQLIISFPSLEVGDAIEVKWTVCGRHPEYQGQFFSRYTFGDDHYPVVRDELRVGVAKERTLKYAAVGGKSEPVVREEGGRRVLIWTATNRRELPQDENLPSKEDLRQEVALSTFASWEEVAHWKQHLRADCWECTADVRKLVRELTRDLKTPLERARGLTYWVRRNVRYVSLGEKHDYTPHAPAQVLTMRYGDCKDQSQLLAVMLREAGVPVHLATLGALDDGQVLENLPSPWGTHAILLTTIDGKDHWIDTTTSLAGWDHLPREDCNRLCYVVDDQAHLRLVRTPAMTPADNRVEQESHITVGADGSSRCERTAVYSGSAATVQRDSWLEVPPGERRRLVTGELQDNNSHARLVRLNIDDKSLRDPDKPVRGELVFEVPGHFAGDADREGSVSDSRVWSKLLAYNLDYDRTVALDLSAPFESRHRWTISLPPAFHFEAVPKEKTVQSRWGAFVLTVHADASEPRRVEVEMDTRLDRVRVEPAEFEEFRKFHEEVAKYYRVWFTLKPVADLDDVALLEAVLAHVPEDSISAAILARLYQEHHLTKDARRVLQRARHYKPADPALLELSVKLAETLAEEESAYRELVQHFPDEPKYAVALGATLTNRGAYAQARTVLEPIAKDGAETVRARAAYQLARGSFRQNRAKEAAQFLEDAVQADPDSMTTVEALSFRGRVCEKLGQGKEALAAYSQALKVDAESEEALLALVRLHWAAKQKADAVDALRRYTLVVGHDLGGLANAADWSLRLGRTDDAFDLASRAREIGFHAKAQRVLGLVCLQHGQYAEAVLHLGKADLDGEVLTGLLRSNLALGNLVEAASWHEQFAKVENPAADLRRVNDEVRDLLNRRQVLLKEPGLPAGKGDAWRAAVDHCLCAEHAHDRGAPAEQVEALLKGAFQAGADLGPAYALRGLLALEHGRLGKALADAEQAVTRTPNGARGYYVRGRVRLERGDRQALADLEKAAALSQRQDGAVLHWLAAALVRAGRSPEALAAQREAVERNPSDPELAEQLRELEKGQSSAPRTGGR